MKLAHKVLIVVSIALVLLMGAVNAQEVKLESTVKTYPTEQAAIGGKTTTAWTVVKGVKVPVYTGPRGGHYIVAKNKNGQWVHRTVKVKK